VTVGNNGNGGKKGIYNKLSAGAYNSGVRKKTRNSKKSNGETSNWEVTHQKKAELLQGDEKALRGIRLGKKLKPFYLGEEREGASWKKKDFLRGGGVSIVPWGLAKGPRAIAVETQKKLIMPSKRGGQEIR